MRPLSHSRASSGHCFPNTAPTTPCPCAFPSSLLRGAKVGSRPEAGTRLLPRARFPIRPPASAVQQAPAARGALPLSPQDGPPPAPLGPDFFVWWISPSVRSAAHQGPHPPSSLAGVPVGSRVAPLSSVSPAGATPETAAAPSLAAAPPPGARGDSASADLFPIQALAERRRTGSPTDLRAFAHDPRPLSTTSSTASPLRYEFQRQHHLCPLCTQSEKSSAATLFPW